MLFVYLVFDEWEFGSCVKLIEQIASGYDTLYVITPCYIVNTTATASHVYFVFTLMDYTKNFSPVF